MSPKITIVDENDNVVSSSTKQEALDNQLIHRIVRILVFNNKNEVYLQKRGPEKLSWPNKWDQSVGGHVDAGESYLDAALREAEEELGIKNIKLNEITKYYAENTTEGFLKKRFNMLYVGQYNGEINLSKEEISKGDWFTLEKIFTWMEEKPEDFTPGCIEAFRRYKKS